MPRNDKVTSQDMASKASRVLRDKTATPRARSLAASVLSQRDPAKQTGSKMEDLAVEVMNDRSSSEDARSLAASALSQANRAR
mgnify:CR=1 FL=1